MNVQSKLIFKLTYKHKSQNSNTKYTLIDCIFILIVHIKIKINLHKLESIQNNS